MQAVDDGRSLLAVLAAVADSRAGRVIATPFSPCRRSWSWPPSTGSPPCGACGCGPGRTRSVWPAVCPFTATASLPLRRSGHSFLGWA